MGRFWCALAALTAMLTPAAANATVWNFDIVYWEGAGAPPSDPAEEDFAHFVVDDYWGGTIGNSGDPTGIWTYGHGSYFGLPFEHAFIDIYNDYWGGGFTFTPYSVIDEANEPDFDFVLDLVGPSVLGGEPGDYYIQAGSYDYDYSYPHHLATFRVTISEAAVTAEAPEPASWAMMVGGFGLLGAALRRRRASVAFA